MARRWIVTTLVAAAMSATGGTAIAADQTVSATLSPSVSMTTNPSGTVSGWTLASSGTNTTSGGSMTINANSDYTVTVTGDKTRMTQHDGTDYVTGGATLSAAFQVTAARTGGTAPVAGLGAIAVIGTSSTLATGVGGGTDEYSITLDQATTIADEGLPAGHSYRIVLTYTASSTL